MRIREPAVAGTFYPADPRVLQRDLSEFLASAEAQAGKPSPKALIVPHAGYIYSGPIAASAYARLASLRGIIRRVVLLGPAHRVAIRGLAMLPLDAMRTPLGLVTVDHEASVLLRDLPQVTSNEVVHAAEHSLEVQLPFLQHVLGDFAVVPLVVGDATDEEVAEVFERLWGGPETLFVVSSDLSHYHDDATARRLDAESCRAIESCDPEALDFESACGRVPIRGLLRAARRRGLEVETLDLRNSGDTAGPRDSVVGYGAWAFIAPEHRRSSESDPESRALDLEAELELDAQLLEVARRSIRHGLRNSEPLAVDPQAFLAPLREPGAAFVTLRDTAGSLRGCVGSLEPRRSLVEDVAANAWAAASRDSRFLPVSTAELPDLRLHLSILQPPEPLVLRSREDLHSTLRPGRDGLILEDRGQRATFLPQVWESIGDVQEFVGLLWQKAGLPPDHWSSTARAWRYEARSVAEE